jgi:TRAP-type C4-dicarboxylate transport system permease small subunit
MDETPVGRMVVQLTAAVAIAGGVSLAAATAVTVLSVVGRALIPLGLGPIPGDFELVQAATLFAVFCFLPWCHLERGHAFVAILTDRLPLRLGAALEFIWDAVMAIAAAFIAWRFTIGLLDKLANGESTFILRIPLWLVYAGGAIGAATFVLAALYCAVRSGTNALSTSPIAPVSGGGE